MSIAAYSFAELLAQDCDHEIPSTDALVIAALNAYGAVFKKRGKTAEAIASRADLLAGLTWLHTNHATLPIDLARASTSQQKTLADALLLDYDELSKLATWPTMVARRVLQKLLPGNTPIKRARSADSSGDGQIVKPGAPAPPQNGGSAVNGVGASNSPDSPAKKSRAAGMVHKDCFSSGSHSSSSSGNEDPTPTGAIRPGPRPKLADMPPILADTAVIRQLVAARCARPWGTTDKVEACIPARHRAAMFRAKSWTTKLRDAYDRMVSRAVERGGTVLRRENPSDPAFVHRISFEYGGDDSLANDGALLAMACTCERPSDFVGLTGAAVGGSRAREDYLAITNATRTAWEAVNTSAHMRRSPSSAVLYNLFAGLHALLERRYMRLAAVLSPPGRAREEILANTARQCFELRDYTEALRDDLARRAGDIAYELQADFEGDRYVTFLKPAMDALLLPDVGALPGSRLSAAMNGGSGPPAPKPAAARSILKPAPIVSFAPDAGGGAYTPAALPPPATPYGAWPHFAPHYGGPPPFTANTGTWLGYTGPLGSPAAVATPAPSAPTTTPRAAYGGATGALPSAAVDGTTPPPGAGGSARAPLCAAVQPHREGQGSRARRHPVLCPAHARLGRRGRLRLRPRRLLLDPGMWMQQPAQHAISSGPTRHLGLSPTLLEAVQPVPRLPARRLARPAAVGGRLLDPRGQRRLAGAHRLRRAAAAYGCHGTASSVPTLTRGAAKLYRVRVLPNAFQPEEPDPC